MDFCRRSALPAACLALLLTACSCNDKKAVGRGPPPPAALDTTVDREGAKQSWVVGVARDPAGLTALAQSNPGWGKLFTSDPAGALAEFAGPARTSPPGSPLRIGAARAALELASTHAVVGQMVVQLTRQLAGAKTETGGLEAAGWRAYVEARLEVLEGRDPAPALARIPPSTPAEAYGAALKPAATGPLAMLLAGKPEGATALLPPGTAPEYGARLAVRALLAAPASATEAAGRFGAISPTAPDVAVGEGNAAVALRDPALADLGARIAAQQCLDILGTANDWSALLRARALLLLGRPSEAVTVLGALLKAPPAQAALADLVLTDALSAADLKLEATALLARAQAAAGDAAGGKATAATLPADTIAHRVLRNWAVVGTGGAFDAAAFPDDRSTLAHTLASEVDALGASAPGAADVVGLALVDRVVDAVQRRYADAAAGGGVPEMAVKHLENAEDKAEAKAPSPRNHLTALALAAEQNLRIGRPRVALTYLIRLAERFPFVAAPADMLRDLLAIKAMGQGGGATSGQ